MNSFLNRYEWISRYNEGDLDGKELEEFLQKLASDPVIRSETELDRELTEFLRDNDLLEFRRILDQAKIRRRRSFGLNCLLLAALLLVLVGLSGFWIYQNPVWSKYVLTKNTVAEASHAHKSQSRTGESLFLRKTPGFSSVTLWERRTGQDLLAASFRPLSYMEGMVGIVTREGIFHLQSPGSSVILTAGDSLRFKWNKDGGSILSFNVINNRGESVVSCDSIPGASLTLLTSSWQDGLYYWKFIERDHLVNVGKIIVRK